jgi:uncharacterized protein YecE (DUF72 family)
MGKDSNGIVKIGCCGFPVGKKRYYKELFLVEVQKSFYGGLSKELAQKWREEAPANFEFTLKASQIITHPSSSPTYRRYPGKINEKNVGYFCPSEPVINAFQESKSLARILQAKIILFQTPRSFTPEKGNISNMEKFFSSIEREDFLLAWEPRGKWEASLVKGLCQELNLIHCVDPFLLKPVWGEILYLRLHGGRGYRHKYTVEELSSLLQWIKKASQETYLLFNNVYMWDDARACVRLWARI